ncbi:MAG: hypothetical protein QOF38_1787, partial [Pseudonocardiales bacterium]|nr:hypothetical protein [Pseudonocardiales bacterium]
ETVDIWRSPLPELRRPAPSVPSSVPPPAPTTVPSSVPLPTAGDDLGTTAFLAKAAAHSG